MQWWCSARTAAWEWTWQAYPGVWLFVLALAGAYLWLRARGGDEPGGEACAGQGAGPPVAPREEPVGRARGHPAWYVTGLLLLWVALDWPVGALGASYLVSVHMAQMLVLAMVAPALLLLGIPLPAWRGLRRHLAGRPLRRRSLRFVTHPLVALLVFNVVVVGTHVPAVLDLLSATQVGMLTMDLLWIGAGLLFWWPVIAPVPRRPSFGHLLKIGYLFLNTLPVTVPYGFLVFAEYPVYATYELAPPMPGISTVADQQAGGLIMKIGGGLILWAVMGWIFYVWYREEQRDEPEPALPRRGPRPERAPPA